MIYNGGKKAYGIFKSDVFMRILAGGFAAVFAFKKYNV